MNKWMVKLNSLSYPQMIALGYFLVIMVGTLLLMLPVANYNNMSPGFINALFTATSATCVTGLVIFDTYTQWTIFGELVILTLIQIGGLGFMTIITLFSFFLKRKIGLKERGLLKESVSTMYIGGVVRLTRKILLGTLLFEGAGAILLSIRFVPKMGWAEGIYNGIFHSVSAFCNAGFDIMGKYGEYSSLTTFSGDAVVNLTIMALIIIGGIGFLVWDDLSKSKFHFRRYQLHTKIVLSTTVILIAVGALCFYVSEKDNLLSEMPMSEKILASLFASVTPRTAGFNTVDMAKISPAAKLLTMVLMFIGGSPGSTAGGIKTTTLAVVMISLWSSLRNMKSENVFGRRLEENALKKASAVITVNLVLVLSAAFLISATNVNFYLSDVLFEVLSAIGTVGLTIGITSKLNSFAHIILALLMYSGRVGSLSFALVFTEHKIPSTIQNPTEKINIG
ncbi:Trk family potassium uptake protein [Clostridium thermosuccinogenes]|uniref:Trk family potassium uptake protein n=2 Tax=Clostridium thermosuccinogenes TaxID=84032 RepID=A0A2K2FLF4_9CLOT|nr:TrkH family potassium uptake protein [Pseudoclostridium thermosuccinogenes]AUS96966.1 Trk family potassium uptake protein [Pseudoclostridium thermosuccinogenes]PNT99617.1 Trk family potassium uptake protein [Pseudoclostridium thermosuccinogenes]PNU01249.1 Trk family potassium uptake protein [Pseudoclostridium thermosuccinogenes]